ncbi:MAG TPA: hypothetical protein VFW27_38735 [Actinoplanes sp.]|jgi:hypothetical protein|nr:hypothetical protein [Actinoplanes sp.]
MYSPGTPGRRRRDNRLVECRLGFCGSATGPDTVLRPAFRRAQPRDPFRHGGLRLDLLRHGPLRHDLLRVNLLRVNLLRHRLLRHAGRRL